MMIRKGQVYLDKKNVSSFVSHLVVMGVEDGEVSYEMRYPRDNGEFDTSFAPDYKKQSIFRSSEPSKAFLKKYSLVGLCPKVMRENRLKKIRKIIDG